METKKVNEHLIKISSAKIAIDYPLAIDDEVQFSITADVVKVEDSTNQDGTIDRTYVVRTSQVLPIEL